MDYAGDVMLLLAWYKLLDDAKDENRFYAKATMVLLRSIYRDLRKQYPDLCKGIEENLAKLAALEQAKCDSIDQAADAFSQIMKIIFQEGVRTLYEADAVTIEPEHPAKEHADPQFLIETAGQIGWHLGKWIYLIDAVDDIEENLKTDPIIPCSTDFPTMPPRKPLKHSETGSSRISASTCSITWPLPATACRSCLCRKTKGF